MPTYDSRFVPPAPVARVSLRNPESHASVGNISMVIDTGADMTFIPRSVVNDLDLPFASEQGYNLRAFDGRSAMASAVKADMLFLGLTFKGIYLIREEEVGIIGRDVLNHFALVLDGPHLNWART